MPKNGMIGTKIFILGAIEKKLAESSMAIGGHLGFWQLDHGFLNGVIKIQVDMVFRHILAHI